MIRGFSMIELLVCLTLTLTVFSLVMTNISQSVKTSREITKRQNLLEAVFFTVDRLKEDLTKCGMRFQDLCIRFNLSVFQNTDTSIKITYGKTSTSLFEKVNKGENVLAVHNLHCFKKKKSIIIYDPSLNYYEFARIAMIKNSLIYLEDKLHNSYVEGSTVILVKNIEYKFYSDKSVLKRKVDNGYFQPMVEEVTDFYVSFYPQNSALLYRLEINHKEQVQGYIFLINMVIK